MTGDLLHNLDLLARAGPVSGMTDAQLLERYTGRGGESAEIAFAAIVARHGPMVLGVCRHVLPDANDVHDAFQATFLVLVRKARSVRFVDSLGPWLYGVSYRVAARARSDAARRRGRETGGLDALTAPQAHDAERNDVQALLHAELNRLPEKYRVPVVLCHLEGKTHEEAARALRCPVGTVSGRLSRARGLLRDRLRRRGVAPPAGAFALPLAAPPAVSPALLLAATLTAGRGSASVAVRSLAQGVLTAMIWNRIKTAALAAAATGTLAVGAGWAFSQSPAAIPPTAKPPSVRPPVPASAPEPGDGPKAESKKDQVKTAAENFTPPIHANLGSSFVVTHAPEPNKVWTMNLADGVWKPYSAPEGTKVDWFMIENLLVLNQQGPAIKELAFYDEAHGGWSTQPLKKTATEVLWETVMGSQIFVANMSGAAVTEIVLYDPTQGKWSTYDLSGPVKAVRFLGSNPKVLVFMAGKELVAFNISTRDWVPMELPDEFHVRALVGDNAILIQQRTTLYAFSLKTGKWSRGVETAGPPLIEMEMGTMHGMGGIGGGFR